MISQLKLNNKKPPGRNVSTGYSVTEEMGEWIQKLSKSSKDKNKKPDKVQPAQGWTPSVTELPVIFCCQDC